MRHVLLSVPLAATAMLWLTTAGALAGGFAVTTIDSMPTSMQAGQTYRVGYMIRQHGITPIVGATPRILLSRGADAVVFRGWPDGAPGHYVSDVNMPGAGEWIWSVDQSPFGAQALGTLTVESASLPTVQPEPAPKVRAPVELAMVGLVVLTLGGALMTVVAAVPRAIPQPAAGAQRRVRRERTIASCARSIGSATAAHHP